MHSECLRMRDLPDIDTPDGTRHGLVPERLKTIAGCVPPGVIRLIEAQLRQTDLPPHTRPLLVLIGKVHICEQESPDERASEAQSQALHLPLLDNLTFFGSFPAPHLMNKHVFIPT
jgi:hypothetical protein